MKVNHLMSNVSPLTRIAITDPVLIYEGCPKDMPIELGSYDVLNIYCKGNTLYILI